MTQETGYLFIYFTPQEVLKSTGTFGARSDMLNASLFFQPPSLRICSLQIFLTLRFNTPTWSCRKKACNRLFEKPLLLWLS